MAFAEERISEEGVVSDLAEQLLRARKSLRVSAGGKAGIFSRERVRFLR